MNQDICLAVPYVKRDPSVSGVLHGVFFTSEIEASFEGLDPDEGSTLSVETLYVLEAAPVARAGNRFLLAHGRTGGDAQLVYEDIEPDEARRWLEGNEHPDAVEKYFTRGRVGRPSIGPKIQANIPPRLHDRIKADMDEWGLTEAEVIRTRLASAYNGIPAEQLRYIAEAVKSARREQG